MSTTLLFPRESNSRSGMQMMRDWRKSLREPSYKIGNRTLTFKLNALILILMVLFCVILFIYLIHPVSKYSAFPSRSNEIPQWPLAKSSALSKYNKTYPLTSPFLKNGLMVYRIALVADLDTSSKSKTVPNTWESYLKYGYLSYNRVGDSVDITWDSGDPQLLTSSFSLKDRGMELSELVVFNGKLLTFDDRTGLIYEITHNKAIPWILLTDGDGSTSKGFKSEWATVKDDTLYVGSMGKEWTTSSGDFENFNPMYIKIVTTTGEVRHVSWVDNFKAVRGAMDINWPAYMIHESGVWSEKHHKWYFLPRRCSKERYNETKDESMGCNVLIECDENFHEIKVTEIGPLTFPTRGFSSFKFIPGTEDQTIIALKSEEFNGKTSTYYTVFSVTGKIIVPDTKIETDLKYEGLEFV